jgi:hypothetical protein
MRIFVLAALGAGLLAVPASAQGVADLDQYDLGVHCAAVETSYASIFTLADDSDGMTEELLQGAQRWLEYAGEQRPDIDEDAMLEDFQQRNDAIFEVVSESMLNEDDDQAAADLDLLLTCISAEQDVFGSSTVASE